ncbi:MAG TPA: hypothetical protein DDW55_04840 [Gammaproteobacteria bacterium]|nr:hypothetical protein [Gammaproteobacteria bacterium]
MGNIQMIWTRKFLLVLGLSISVTAAADEVLSSGLNQQQLMNEVSLEMQQYQQEALHDMKMDLQQDIGQMLAVNQDLVDSQMAEAEMFLYPEKLPFKQAECDPQLITDNDTPVL